MSQTEVVRVLLVEDSPTEGMLIQAVLEDTDYPRFTVARAVTMAEALAALREQTHDVVVLDLTLPDSHGLETFRTVHDEFPEMAVVVVTANDSKTLALEAIKIGAQDYIVKEQVENMPLGLSLRFAMERKGNQNEITRRQKGLDAVIRATPVGTLLITTDLRIRLANDAAAALSGKGYMDLADLALGPALACAHAQDDPRGCGFGTACTQCPLRLTCLQVFEGGKPVLDVETQITLIVRGQTRTLWLRLSCSPVTIDGLTHVILAFNDVTSAVEAMQMKSRLMSMVSHELRSPLGAMKEGTEILLEELPGPINEKQRELLEIVHRNVTRLHRLTSDFLDLQKLKAGKMSFNPQDGDINQVIEDVGKTMRPAAEAKGVTLATVLDRKVQRMRFDKDRMFQVVMNLANNALKFTDQGQVTLRTTAGSTDVRISVHDTGCGMKADEIPKLFGEFQQLSNTKSGGTGLGLAIAHKIILEHHGSVSVASTLGKGTTITVSLPVLQAQQPATDTQALVPAKA